MVLRDININENIKAGKVLIIYGARRVGKTYLLHSYLGKCGLKYKLDSGDDIRIQDLLSNNRIDRITEYAEGYELIALDEAQRINNLGFGLKILIDARPDLNVIVTGSSLFEINQQVGEPLTGRKRELMMFPFSQNELLNVYNKYELKEKLNGFLVFGSYPEIALAKNKQEKTELLVEIVNSYLFKDVLSVENIRGNKQIIDLLKLLAFQIGSQVSVNELATQVRMDVKTIQRYLDILERAFVVKRLTPYSKNLRKEITSKNKYYFIDNGIRNGLIMQFNDLSYRNDVGQLFENFILSERLKHNEYKRVFTTSYFWRTFDKKEIDLVEELNGQLNAYEIKYGSNKKYKVPNDFINNYLDSTFKVVDRENYLEFVL